jgi:ABC-type sulfate transport system substrate-binding protein
MVRYGPSKYDVVMVYENLAIESLEAAQRQHGQPLRVYYPPATSLSDHPYAILDAPLTTAAEREAATRFRDFLLARPAQELALQRGFRPASPEVSIGGPNNPFERYASFGVRAEIDQQVETPPAAVMAALIDLWELRIQPLTLNR